MADIDRLNTEIAEEEKAIDILYRKIGKKYVDLYREKPEQPFAELVQEVGTAQAKIRACRVQIGKIKGVQFCESCGSEVELGAAFCGECGAAMPEPPLPDDCIRCPHCKGAVKQSMRFCTRCGHEMAQPQKAEPAPETRPAERQAPAQEPDVHTVPQVPRPAPKPAFAIPTAASQTAPQAPAFAFPGAMQEPGNICPACGTAVEAGMRFCTECGHPMTDQPAPVPAAKTASPAKDGYHTCPNCGARNDADLFFCTQCGSRL
ncbi:MAG: zinc ribbon domain-containing protein [Gemmiger sp.]